MPRDMSYQCGVSSLESIAEPFIDFYPLESHEYIYTKALNIIDDSDIEDRIKF